MTRVCWRNSRKERSVKRTSTSTWVQWAAHIPNKQRQTVLMETESELSFLGLYAHTLTVIWLKYENMLYQQCHFHSGCLCTSQGWCILAKYASVLIINHIHQCPNMINKRFYWKSKCFQGKGLSSNYMTDFYKYIIYIFPVTNSAYIKYI